ncbi:MAG: pilin [Halieaceae bacterium]
MMALSTHRRRRQLAGSRIRQRGLTMLELLVAMFIVSLLVMVGLPAYKDYQVRTQVTRDFALVQQAKTNIAEYYAINARLPRNNTDIGMQEYWGFQDGKFNFKLIVGSFGSIDATIILVYNTQEIPELDGWETLVFNATESNGYLSWDCSSGGSMPNKYRPSTCRR